MQSQASRLFNVDPSNITTPENDEFVTIFRNKLDGIYYGKRASGVIEPLIGVSSPSKGIFNNTGSPFSDSDFSSQNFGDFTQVILSAPLLALITTINASPYLAYFSANSPSVIEEAIFTNNPLLRDISFSNASLIDKVDFHGNPILSSINLGSAAATFPLDTVNISSCPLLLTVVLIRQSLPQSVVDYILLTLDNNGLSNGLVNLSLGASSAPTGGGANANVLSLLGKGWTVTIN